MNRLQNMIHAELFDIVSRDNLEDLLGRNMLSYDHNILRITPQYILNLNGILAFLLV